MVIIQIYATDIHGNESKYMLQISMVMSQIYATDIHGNESNICYRYPW